MNTNTCATCKHWRRGETTTLLDQRFGKCLCPAFLDTSWRDAETPPEDGLLYWDLEGYNADFATGEAFGCIHHDQANTTERRSAVE